jgi:hypothetical protein
MLFAATIGGRFNGKEQDEAQNAEPRTRSALCLSRVQSRTTIIANDPMTRYITMPISLSRPCSHRYVAFKKRSRFHRGHHC